MASQAENGANISWFWVHKFIFCFAKHF